MQHIYQYEPLEFIFLLTFYIISFHYVSLFSLHTVLCHILLLTPNYRDHNDCVLCYYTTELEYVYQLLA